MDGLYTGFELHQLLMGTAATARQQVQANPVLEDHILPGEPTHPSTRPESSGK